MWPQTGHDLPPQWSPPGLNESVILNYFDVSFGGEQDVISSFMFWELNSEAIEMIMQPFHHLDHLLCSSRVTMIVLSQVANGLSDIINQRFDE